MCYQRCRYEDYSGECTLKRDAIPPMDAMCTINDTAAENAELRELVRDLMDCPVDLRDCETCEHAEVTPKSVTGNWDRYDCKVRARAWELVKCHDVDKRSYAVTCSECKATVLLEVTDSGEPTYSVDGVADVPKYCPNCGRRFVDETCE